MYRVRPPVELVLASASPRRREMLSRIGLAFSLAPAEIDETLEPGESVEQAAQRLASLKAGMISARRPQASVLAADTLVAIDGHILGKPSGKDEAKRMLGLLSGREHRVVTGFCLRSGAVSQTGLAHTKVRFRPLAEDEIQAYVDSGEPMGKAGAYAVQGVGAALVESVSGSYTNVVGLPLAALVKLMLKQGVIEPLSR